MNDTWQAVSPVCNDENVQEKIVKLVVAILS
jgi:hypothetical protein